VGSIPTPGSPARSLRDRRWRLLYRLVALAGASAPAVAVALAPTAVAASTPLPPEESWTVVEVVDGDTLDIEHGTVVLTVRLIGINAPERGECWADEADAALTELVAGGEVWLEVDVSDRDDFGRLLRYVYNERGEDVGERLLEQGAAIARSYPPDTANDERYAAAQDAAAAAGRGLWAPDACSPSRLAPVAAIPPSIGIDIRADADGDDNLNLNDEWVRFSNTGVAPLDLTGWTVKDESATHRYVFTTFELAPGTSVTLRTGCGVDSATELFWCNEDSAVWNNSGDTVFLLDPAGNIVATLRY
jgi:endonuclease YncB( thermonuclease family)